MVGSIWYVSVLAVGIFIPTQSAMASMVSKPSRVKADNTASSGTRYKYGRNLNINKKDVFKIHEPENREWL